VAKFRYRPGGCLADFSRERDAACRTDAVVPDSVSTATPACPEVSIVVPHLNQFTELAACLASLARQDLPAERAEIIVVDNGSDTLPEAVIAPYPNVRLVTEPLPGPGPARNRGIALSCAPIIVFLDADCLASPGWLSAILARFAADPNLPALGGAVQVFAANQDRPTAAEAFDLVFGFRQEWQISHYNFSATANLAVRRRVLELVGPFGGIGISEDLDWGQRAARLGYRTRYAPEVLVHHPARHTMQDLKVQWDRHVSHFYGMQARTPLARLRWLVSAARIGLSPIADLPRLLTSSRLAGPRARALAFVGLVRIRLYRAHRMIAALVNPEARTASIRWNR
jgi:GT2 family glycosyltransferase